MATFRKRKNKWQAIVRHKDIGTVSRSFFKQELSAVTWALEAKRTRLELGLHGKLCPFEHVNIRSASQPIQRLMLPCCKKGPRKLNRGASIASLTTL